MSDITHEKAADDPSRTMFAQYSASDGPHAKAVAEMLRKAVDAHYGDVSAFVREFGAAMIRLREPAELEETMRRVARFALAAEALHKAAGLTHKDARAALLRAFDETGVPGVFLPGFTVTACEGEKPVHVVDPSHPALELFYVPREPALDKDAVRRALEAREDLGGAAVLGNSGTRYVRFSKREKSA